MKLRTLLTLFFLPLSLNACATSSSGGGSTPQAPMRAYTAVLQARIQATPDSAPILRVAPPEDGLLSHAASLKLSRLASNVSSKVMVIDFGLGYHEGETPDLPVLPNENPRVKLAFAQPTVDGGHTVESKYHFSHGVYVIESMMNDLPYVPHPGFLTQHGQVLFYTQSPNCYGNPDAWCDSPSALYEYPEPFERFLQEGYSILNVSWGTNISLVDAQNIYYRLSDTDLPSYNKVFDKQKPQDQQILNLFRLIGLKKAVDQMDGGSTLLNWLSFLNQETHDHDLLWIYAMGNEADRKYDLASLMIVADQDQPQDQRQFSALYETSLGVISYNEDHARTFLYANGEVGLFYSNSCRVVPEICVQGFGNAYASEAIYENGTSFAAPYVASVAALVRGVFPFFTNKNLQTTVLTTAQYTEDVGDRYDVPVPRPGGNAKPYNSKYGWGVVQPQKAIQGPELFYRRNFVVDFTHHADWISPGHHDYRFSLNIGGQYGLTLLGNPARADDLTLTLSGKNTYAGATHVGAYAQLRVTGQILHSPIQVDAHARLMGSGIVADVQNGGEVLSYDPMGNVAKAPDIQDASRAVPIDALGLYVRDNYTETGADSRLRVILGQPLNVGGTATLQGQLQVDGLKTAHWVAPHETVQAYALVAPKVQGKWQQMHSNTPLLTQLSQRQVAFNDGQRSYAAVLVQGRYQSATQAVARGSVSPRLASGAWHYDQLHDQLSHQKRAARSSAAIARVWLLSLQGASRPVLESALQALDFTPLKLRYAPLEAARSYLNNQMLLGPFGTWSGAFNPTQGAAYPRISVNALYLSARDTQQGKLWGVETGVQLPRMGKLDLQFSSAFVALVAGKALPKDDLLLKNRSYSGIEGAVSAHYQLPQQLILGAAWQGRWWADHAVQMDVSLDLSWHQGWRWGQSRAGVGRGAGSASGRGAAGSNAGSGSTTGSSASGAGSTMRLRDWFLGFSWSPMVGYRLHAQKRYGKALDPVRLTSGSDGAVWAYPQGAVQFQHDLMLGLRAQLLLRGNVQLGAFGLLAYDLNSLNDDIQVGAAKTSLWSGQNRLMRWATGGDLRWMPHPDRWFQMRAELQGDRHVWTAFSMGVGVRF